MANKGPYIGIQMVPTLEGRMEQRLVMTPPMASSVDQVVANAHLRADSNQKELSDDVLGAVNVYIASEDSKKPYNDKQILGHLKSLGYQDLNRRDIALARNKLGISASANRYKA